jgi:hypothetical protein
MRLVERPLSVLAPAGCVQSFSWRGETYIVTAVLEKWADTGAWWECEPEKVFYRLLADDGGLYELYQECLSGKWYLYKVYD